jgi:hypothetical protein
MPLSRHFYSLDEVHTAIQYTCNHGPPVEALFWTQEMIYSGCVGEAISALFQAWLWNTGPMSLQWLLNATKSIASDELSEQDILLAAHQLSSIHYSLRDSSIWNILVLTTVAPNEMPDTITRKVPPGADQYTDEKEFYFVCALFQGKARAAWWAAQYIDTARVWDILNWYVSTGKTKYKDEYLICLKTLNNYEPLLGYQSVEYDTITRCCAIIAVALPPKAQIQSFKDLEYNIRQDGQEMLSEFEKKVGRRQGRLYTIPKMALYGTTLRGCSKWAHHNLTQLYNIEKYLVGCTFWDEAIAEYGGVTDENGGQIEWTSDEKKEEFYAEYFPDDIPDEWSKMDQQKSHGDGILGPTDKPNMVKYARMYMAKMSRFAWNTSNLINTHLVRYGSVCALEKIVEGIPPVGLSEELSKRLKPVHKIKII